MNYRSVKNLLRCHQAEPVTMNIYDFDIGIVFQVFAEFRNVNIHTAAVEISIAAPDLFQRALSW
jgi:hypothetical protein